MFSHIISPYSNNLQIVIPHSNNICPYVKYTIYLINMLDKRKKEFFSKTKKIN